MCFTPGHVLCFFVTMGINRAPFRVSLGGLLPSIARFCFAERSFGAAYDEVEGGVGEGAVREADAVELIFDVVVDAELGGAVFAVVVGVRAFRMMKLGVNPATIHPELRSVGGNRQRGKKLEIRGPSLE